MTVYLDHHATTPLDPRVRDAMLPWLGERFGNPDSLLHAGGRAARDAVAAAREDVAALVGARPDEVIFTSGATEANALAMTALGPTGALVTQATEHRAVLAHAERRQAAGAPVRILPVDRLGRIAPADLEGALSTRPRLASLMLANNEVGTAHDVSAFAGVCAAAGVLSHVDAAQGVGYLPLDLAVMPVDFVSVSAHKMYGPMGVGALVARRGAQASLAPLLLGGGQERGLRAGTVNVLGVVGFGAAARIQRLEGRAEAARLAALRQRLWERLEASGAFARNGDPDASHPGNLSVVVRGVSADRLALAVEDHVAFGTGAACSTGRRKSHVLVAMGLDDDAIRRTIRLGLGRFTTEAEVDHVAEALRTAVAGFA